MKVGAGQDIHGWSPTLGPGSHVMDGLVERCRERDASALVQDVVAPAAQAIVDDLLLLVDAVISAGADANRTTRRRAESSTLAGADAAATPARRCKPCSTGSTESSTPPALSP